jgi:hypothetical protein
MKFVRESDIAAFKGKEIHERFALRWRAQWVDKRIFLLTLLKTLLVIGLLGLCMFLHKLGILPTFLEPVVGYLSISLLLSYLFDGFFITPLLKDILDRQNTAEQGAAANP